MKRRTIFITYIFVISLAIAEVSFFSVVNQVDTVEKIVIAGNLQNYTQDELIKYSQVSTKSSYVLLNAQDVENKMQSTKRFKSVSVSKTIYRQINIFADANKIIGRQIIGDETKDVLENSAIVSRSSVRPPVPIIDETVVDNQNYLIPLAKNLGQISDILLNQFSEIKVTNPQESTPIFKIITNDGDIIFITNISFVYKLSKFIEMDTIMNQKSIPKCEYHFEFSETNVNVKSIS